jgi:hypothetical protein
MKLNYKGLVAMIIASTLGASMMITIAGLAWRDKQVSEQGGQVLIALTSGLLVALGYYMGSKNDKPPTNDSHDQAYK